MVFNHFHELKDKKIDVLSKLVTYQEDNRIVRLETTYLSEDGIKLFAADCGTDLELISPDSIKDVVEFNPKKAIQTIFSGHDGEALIFIKFLTFMGDVFSIGDELALDTNVEMEYQDRELKLGTSINWLEGSFKSNFFYIIKVWKMGRCICLALGL